MTVFYLVLALMILHSQCLEEGNDIESYLPKPVIGVYLDEKASMRDAFSLAVHTVNKCMYDHEICEMIHPSELGINLRLFHQVEFTAVAIRTPDDFASVRNNFGKLAGVTSEQDITSTVNDEQEISSAIQNDKGLAVVIGPHRRASSLYVQGLCEIHDLPHIVIGRQSNLEHTSYQPVNLYPDTETLANVYLDFVKVLNWTSFAILYQNSENFVALHNMLQLYQPYTYGVYGFKLGNGPNYSTPLFQAKQMEHKSFLVDCEYDILNDVLTQIQEAGMMTDSYRYIITTLDIHAIDWYQYQYSGVNVKGMQLIDIHNPFVRDFVEKHLDDFGIESVEKLQLKDALMFDAVALFAQAYKDLNYQNQMFRYATFRNKQYDKPLPWKNGLSLRNYMLFTETIGLTGPVLIDGDGIRRRFKLDVVDLETTGLRKVGQWDFEDGFQNVQLEVPSKLPHYKVLISLNAPYAVKVNHTRNIEGNARYEGLVVDIMEELANDLKFTYTLYVQEDKNNGDCISQTVNDQIVCIKCSGMMRKVYDKEVDMAITDLTMTESRAKCVQFSTSFMNLGITILAKKPQKVPSWYSFLTPYDYRVWLYMALSMILVPILFFILGRLSPAEWNNPYPCVNQPTELHNQFTINNAVWFTMGAILQQGSEIAPIGASTRILAASWYFFCLIMFNTYVANLAAFLTIETPVRLINGIDDLFDQNTIKFGAKINGSTYSYFRSSAKYYRLYEKMSDPEWQKLYMVKENDDGVEMVKRNDTDYVFFMESSTIDYVVKRNCELEKIGDLIDHKSYAIAYTKVFPIHKELSRAISRLEEKSILNDLRKKWWDARSKICDKEDNSTEPLTEEQLRGIFIVLAVGLLLSTVATLYTSSSGIRSIAKTEELGFMETVKIEMKNMTQSKPIKPVLSKQRSTETNLTDRSWNSVVTTRA